MQKRAKFFVALAVGCALAGTATAGDWLTFSNESSERLVASDSGLGVSDNLEKDYAWADIDQDGDIDLVVVRKFGWTFGNGARNVLFMNEGGVLVDRTVEFASSGDEGQGFLDVTNDRDVALTDVNLDGWLDIVTAPAYGAPPRIYINLGKVGDAWQGFHYEPARVPVLGGTVNSCGVTAGDVDGNGAPDLYFVTYNSTFEDFLLMNDGTGFFTDETSSRVQSGFTDSGFGSACYFVDLDGDDDLDIIKSENGPIDTAYNNGSGFYTVWENVYSGAAYHVGIGDLNGDGMVDFFASDDAVDRYVLNQGTSGGTVNWSNEFLFPSQTNDFGSNSLTADLDKDGWEDVVIADVDVDASGCSRVSDILRNNGNPPNNTFTHDTANIPSSFLQGSHDIGVFDLNGDSWLDLVIGTCSGTSVWINQPPQPPCATDLSGNGSTGAEDLATLLGAWGPNPGHPADFSGNGAVGAEDLAVLLGAWGDC